MNTDHRAKPCPFCGTTQDKFEKEAGLGVYVCLWAPSSDQEPYPSAVCLQCGIGGPLEKWNMRKETE